MGCSSSKEAVVAEPEARAGGGILGPTGEARSMSLAANGRWSESKDLHCRCWRVRTADGRKLQKMGYQNVHVYESAGRVGGYATTIEADGHYFDVATKYIPTATAHGKGAVPPFQEIMDEYQEKYGFFLVRENAGHRVLLVRGEGHHDSPASARAVPSVHWSGYELHY